MCRLLHTSYLIGKKPVFLTVNIEIVIKSLYIHLYEPIIMLKSDIFTSGVRLETVWE